VSRVNRDELCVKPSITVSERKPSAQGYIAFHLSRSGRPWRLYAQSTELSDRLPSQGRDGIAIAMGARAENFFGSGDVGSNRSLTPGQATTRPLWVISGSHTGWEPKADAFFQTEHGDKTVKFKNWRLAFYS